MIQEQRVIRDAHFNVYAVLGIKPDALCMPGKKSGTWVVPGTRESYQTVYVCSASSYM